MTGAAVTTRRTLVVTNDFPPRQGGIQSFVHELARRQPAGLDRRLRLRPRRLGRVRRRAAVPGRAAPDRAAGADARPRGGGSRRCCASTTATAVWFGAVGAARPARPGAARGRAPSGSSPAPTATRSAGRCCRRARQALRRIGDALRRRHLPRRVHPQPAGRRRSGRIRGCVQLTPGVDVETFRPGVDGAAVRARLRAGRPSGHRVRVAAGAAQGPGRADRGAAARSAARCPDAALLLVGAGPYERDAARAGRSGTAWPTHVVFTGGVPYAGLPAHYAAGDVFAMPCRTRRGGPGRRGARHRLPRGVGHRAAGRRRRLRRRAGRRARGRDRLRRRRPRRRRGRRSAGRACCSDADAAARDWARPAGPGSSSSWRWDVAAPTSSTRPARTA